MYTHTDLLKQMKLEDVETVTCALSDVLKQIKLKDVTPATCLHQTTINPLGYMADLRLQWCAYACALWMG